MNEVGWKGEDLESTQGLWATPQPPLQQSKAKKQDCQVRSPPHQRVLEVHEPAVIQREPALLKSLSLLRREEVTFVR